MGHAQRILPSYTYDDYVHWEGRWELIDGIPFAMSPLPSPKHQWVASELRSHLRNAIKKEGCKTCRAYDPVDYKIAEDTILQPDILIVCGKISKPFLDFPPSLVVEILSPSTALRDRHTKFDLYESTGVKYYIIVDAEKEIFELYELTNGKYVVKQKVANAPTLFDLDDDCSISVQLDEVWS
jgi:Uma2 family endonuclease